MKMKKKTMEFDNIVATYDYETRDMTVRRADDKVNAAVFVFNSDAIEELRSALEGIGKQVMLPHGVETRRKM